MGPGNDIDKTWSPVEVLPPGTENDAFPPILVNIGDLLSYWTNGLLKSTVHRVVFPANSKVSGDRYSVAYFCHPANKTELVPVPSELVDKTEAAAASHDPVAGSASSKGTNGNAMTAEEHLRNRLAATYGWGKQDDFTQD